MTHIQKIGMVILMQPDVDAAVTFYKQLGIPLKFHLKAKWAEFELEGVKIGLCPTSRPATDLVRTGLVLQVADLRQAYQDLQGTVTFLNEPVEAVHGIMVSLSDIGGNVIDLYQPTPEKVKELVKKAAEQGEGCGDGAGSTTGSCCRKDGGCN